MKQPLMSTHTGLPLAQAEALDEASPDGAALARCAGDAAAWPGEDWDGDFSAARPPRTAACPQPSLTDAARHKGRCRAARPA